MFNRLRDMREDRDLNGIVYFNSRAMPYCM